MAQQPLPTSAMPTDIYGGDEVSALVLDPGYVHTRAGFAGEDVPKCILPSSYAHIGPSDAAAGDGSGRDVFGDEVLLMPRADLSLRNYMNRDSVVEDWDAAARLWENMLVQRLQPDRAFLLQGKRAGGNDDNNNNGTGNGSGAGGDDDGDVAMEDGGADALEKALSDSPLLVTEAPWNVPKAREKTIELAMEGWGVPAFWLTRTSVAAAFAAGKATALVIDVGGANTSVTAIHDGMVLKRSVQRSPVAGLWLSSQVREMWKACEPPVAVTPSFLIEAKTPVDAGAPAQARLRTFPFALHDSFRAHEEERVITEFKESVVEVWRGPGRYGAPGNEDYVRQQPGRIFEFPDGSNNMWRGERYRVSEGMWDEAAAYPGEGGERLPKSQTLPEVIRAAVNGCDVDVRGNLLANIVVTGSTTLINGFTDRLNGELTAMFPGMKIKLHAAGLTTERRFGAWIGGSILASLGSFHQMWISRKEYEENGAGIVEKRCK